MRFLLVCIIEIYLKYVFFKAFIIYFQFVILSRILFMKYGRAAAVITSSEIQTPPPRETLTPSPITNHLNQGSSNIFKQRTS